jgi:hypothetical protein
MLSEAAAFPMAPAAPDAEVSGMLAAAEVSGALAAAEASEAGLLQAVKAARAASVIVISRT